MTRFLANTNSFGYEITQLALFCTNGQSLVGFIIGWTPYSVTRFDNILPKWPNLFSLGQFWVYLVFSIILNPI